MLQRCVDSIRIFRIDLRPETIAALCDVPIRVDDTRGAASTGWTTKTEVVLSSTINVVERSRIVGRDVVKLRDWQVLFEVPIGPSIKTLENTTIATNEVVIGIFGINPDVMVIDVLRLFSKPTDGPLAVVGNHKKHIHYIDPIHIFGIGYDASVVHRANVEFITSLPTATAIRGTENSTLAIGSFDNRVNHIRVDRRYRNPDSS